ncbi:MAG: bifunctional phosphoribosylaminoimidazolecarboxamide formyltransferase/inosine monophosphate cyclohydrolase [Phycisphaerae bacterium]|nr:bifunctional phosphoribosylaminoimidazolecarboxamide formyltransferase/inosine monophosphate cyclohydrolase [Phycisphaerae bacterium]
MPQSNIRRALIAVYDKAGIVEFARALVDEFGIEILSTGGTARHLSDAGIPVTMVERITGFPEMLDGRVKTLHPKIHAAILADRDNPDHMRQLAEHRIEPIDMVVVNLYPFSATVADPNCAIEQAIEMIDIGGPCLIRAAAKNHRHVLVICNSTAQQLILNEMRSGGRNLEAVRTALATRAFQLTSDYDAAVEAYLAKSVSDKLDNLLSSALEAAGEHPCEAHPKTDPPHSLELGDVSPLRYGENPHQRGFRAALNEREPGVRLLDEHGDAGQDLSFNNLLDADAALAICSELARARIHVGHVDTFVDETASRPHTACVFIKHTNACGVGFAHDPIDAFQKAYLGDPNAAMGGILACNFGIDAAFAVAVMETYDRFGRPLKAAGHPAAPGGFFVEVWVAPHFTPDAVKLIRGTAEPAADLPHPPRKKWGESVRLLAVGDMNMTPSAATFDYKRIAGGMLVQDRDVVCLNEDQWRVVTARPPSEAEWSDLRLAWLIAKHTRSNAISLCKGGMLIGNGAGQMSRVMSCRIATWLARENGHSLKLAGAAAASDAFFPFRDGPDILIDAGVTAMIQPGGSKRDDEVIAACNERGVAMIFTGTRHFKH